MDEGKSFKKFSLAALIAVFILCIVLIIVVNSRTQTAIFWDNQQKALVLITEDCASQINGWASMQEAFTRNLAGDPEHAAVLEELQAKLKSFQQRTRDPWLSKWTYE